MPLVTAWLWGQGTSRHPKLQQGRDGSNAETWRTLEPATREGEWSAPAEMPAAAPAASAQWEEPPATGSRCLLIGAISSLPLHYAVLTPQARRPRAWQNRQGTTAAQVFQSPFLQPCREQEGHQRLQAWVACPKPPKTAEPQAAAQAGDCTGCSLSAGSRSKKGEKICLQAELGGCSQALVAGRGLPAKPHLGDRVPIGSPSCRKGSPSQAPAAGGGLTLS